jgi:hypothetical protein
MSFDPRSKLGPEDGIVTNAEGKIVGFFWENPKTKNMTEEERKAYWDQKDKEQKQ